MKEQTLKRRIQTILEEATDRIGKPETRPEMKLEYARDEKFGDYACTIAMDHGWRDCYSRVDPSFKNPRKFAEAIIQSLKEMESATSVFSSIEIAGPGFINLRVRDESLLEFVDRANDEKENYGNTESGDPRKILFEYVSANPTGPLNIVSARAAALGDSCSNLLRAAGHEVHREYYVNDYGNQVRLLGVSCLYRYAEMEGIPLKFSRKDSEGNVDYPSGPGLPFPAEGYHGEYLSDVVRGVLKNSPELKLSSEELDRLRELAENSSGPEDAFAQTGLEERASLFGKAATNFFLETQQRDLKRFRVEFDEFFRESGLHEAGEVLKVLDHLKGHLYQEEGKTIFRSTDFGDDKDRVVVRDDGRPTYLLADIAYHKTKLDRGYDRIWNIWGPDHHGYIKRLAGALEAMGNPSDRFSVFIAQQVNLLDGGEQIVMSKRTGKFITMETLMDEIPVDVSRYFFIMRSFDAPLDFDMKEAADTTDRNPYFYVAYAHARIRSIFQKAGELGIATEIQKLFHQKENVSGDVAFTPERRRLLWLIARFPEEVKDAAEAMEPHRLVTYLYNLAQAISRFYGAKENKIIDMSPRESAVLLAVLQSAGLCLKNGLHLLGMDAPERMDREGGE